MSLLHKSLNRCRLRLVHIGVAPTMLAAVLLGCGNPPTASTPPPPAQQTALFKVSAALNQIEQTDKQLVTSVIQASDQKLIPGSTTRQILDVAQKVSDGVDQAAAITRGLATLPPGTAINVWTVLKPVSDAVAQSVASGLITIQDAQTKAAVMALLTTIQSSLAVVQLQTGGQ